MTHKTAILNRCDSVLQVTTLTERYRITTHPRNPTYLSSEHPKEQNTTSYREVKTEQNNTATVEDMQMNI